MAKKIGIPPQDKLGLSVDEVAALLGIGRDRVFRLILDIDKTTKRPVLHSVKIGARRIIPRIALDRYIETLMAAA